MGGSLNFPLAEGGSDLVDFREQYQALPSHFHDGTEESSIDNAVFHKILNFKSLICKAVYLINRFTNHLDYLIYESSYLDSCLSKFCKI